MELRDLEYFAVVAEVGNVRRASEALDLSPPALSKSLRRLEAAMQAKLVERSPRGVTLTTVGAALLSRIELLRLAVRDVRREAAELSEGRSGRLNIGANPVDAEMLPAAYGPMLADSPQLVIDLMVSDIDVMFPLLAKGSLDLLIVVRPDPIPDGFACEPLWEDEYVVCCSRHHPLARKRRATCDDLASEGWIMSDSTVRPHQVLHRAFLDRGLPAPRVVVCTRSQRVKLLTCSASRLLTFTSRKIVDGASAAFGLKVLEVPGLDSARPVCAMYREAGYLAPAARRLIGQLRSRATQPRRGQR